MAGQAEAGVEEPPASGWRARSVAVVLTAACLLVVFAALHDRQAADALLLGIGNAGGAQTVAPVRFRGHDARGEFES